MTWDAGGGRPLLPEHERAAWSMIEDAGGTGSFELIVLSGSLVRGMGHALSDLDLYVLPAGGARVSNRARLIDGIPVQFNEVTPALLDELGELFERYQVTPADRSQLNRMLPRLKPATRLAFGTVLHLTERVKPAFERCRPEVVRRLIMTNAAREAARHAEDALGGLDAGDPLIALQAGETGLRYACEVAMAGGGNVYVGESFFWRRLAAAPTTRPLAPTVWSLLKSGPGWGAPLEVARAYVENALSLGAHLAGYAQLDGWDAPAAELPPWERPSGPFRRSPFYGLVRFGETVAIAGPDKGFRTNVAGARAWLGAGASAGAPSLEVMRRFAAMGLLEPAHPATAEGGEQG